MCRLNVLLQFVSITRILVICDSANILCVIPFTGTSHYIMLRPIGLELARRGHNITVITAYQETDHPPSYHQVMTEKRKIWEVLGTEKPNIFDFTSIYDISAVPVAWVGGLTITEIALKSKEVQEFLKQDLKFDVVISEQFAQEAFYYLSHKYNAPLVLVTTHGNCMKHNVLVRNPLQVATVLTDFVSLDELVYHSFYGRLKNFLFAFYDYGFHRFHYYKEHKNLAMKYIPGLEAPLPNVEDIQSNTALMFMNSHFSFDQSIAYLPNVIEIGGVHMMKENGQLPEDLKEILDEAKHGVVYMSFGSNVQSTEMDPDKKQAFLNVFRKLRQTVIWKWEEDEMKGKPDNVITRKWLPQRDILAHPNVIVFISHGGLIGLQEAAFNGIPVIGIPVFGDQYYNIVKLQSLGCGRGIRYQDITEKILGTIINDVLANESYRRSAKELSKRFKDRPMSPLDTAVYWIEYVVRHKGADFMKNPALDLSWIEYQLLDVYTFVLAVFIILLVTVYKILVFVKTNIFLVNTKIKDRNKKIKMN